MLFQLTKQLSDSKVLEDKLKPRLSRDELTPEDK